ncbi:MAG TPA: response regulator transcription factor [Leeuwenhoekiella sp.]|nr:response regulator transcription factor [Leeuwenhoekiella sp.]
MSKFLTFFILSLSCGILHAQEVNRGTLQFLDHIIEKREEFIQEKNAQIAELKSNQIKEQFSGSKTHIYNSYMALYQSYKSFKYDSAYYYLEKAKNIAVQSEDSSHIATSRIEEGFILLSAGLFKEAADTLARIEPQYLSEKDSYNYYYTNARLYFDMAEYNDDQRYQIDYVRKGIKLLYTSLAFCPVDSSRYWKSYSLIQLKEQKWKSAQTAYLTWMKDYELNPNLYAIATSSLSYIYSQLQKDQLAIEYLVHAAISDIKSATKENTALRNLANILYHEGALKKANEYVKIALEDATFYDAKHRKNQISSILPIIESAQFYQMELKNESLRKTVVLLAILALLVLIFLCVIFKQLKEKKIARQALTENNIQLKEMNLNLVESDTIKQDYITYFLKVTSQLINTIGSLQKTAVVKIQTKNPEDLLRVMQNYSVKKERTALFHQFDEVFLKLFPSFISSFNRLFAPEEQRMIKKGELLNTELRIFALYRLGIQDNKQIAEFLDVSISTVYSYKTRLKSSSLCKENFEKEVMRIKKF